jgi:predicted TIM-barrel fold metal-dependent hydrolase
LIDVNVNLSRWPFRRLAGDDPAGLVALLRKAGVSEAWAGSFDGLLHHDISAANSRLAANCARHRGFLVPFGSLNPQLPDWQEDLRRIHEVHRMPGVRLHPNYHGYKLSDPVFAGVLSECARRGLAVQVVLAMEDERTQHWLLRVPPVDPSPLANLLPGIPGLKLMLLNSGNNTPALRGAYFDFAMREGPYAVTRAIAAAGQARIVFGSHAPLFYIESAALKLKEAGLMARQVRTICETNPRSFLKG